MLALLTSACSRDVITIGTLESDLTVPESERFLATIEALKAAGFEGGDNVRYQRRNAEVRGESLETLAAELHAKDNPALILVFDEPSLEAALKSESDIPVVFAFAVPMTDEEGEKAIAQGVRAGAAPLAATAQESPGLAADEAAIGRTAGEMAAEVLRGELSTPRVVLSREFLKTE